jgi:ribosomal protein L17
MRTDIIGFWMTLAGTVCWPVCFLWMHRISAKQSYLLEQLRQQGKRIEKLSKLEHDLIKEVHPQVSEIKEGVEEMIATAKENSESNPPSSKAKKGH